MEIFATTLKIEGHAVRTTIETAGDRAVAAA